MGCCVVKFNIKYIRSVTKNDLVLSAARIQYVNKHGTILCYQQLEARRVGVQWAMGRFICYRTEPRERMTERKKKRTRLKTNLYLTTFAFVSDVNKCILHLLLIHLYQIYVYVLHESSGIIYQKRQIAN